MAETLKKRIGRTAHDIQLLTQFQLVPVTSGMTMFPPGSEEEKGYIAQRLTFFKDTVRRIFRTDTTSTVYSVGKRPFAIFMPQGQFHVPAGVVSNIGLTTFPYHTTLVIYNMDGSVWRQIDLAGNPEIR